MNDFSVYDAVTEYCEERYHEDADLLAAMRAEYCEEVEG